MVFENLTLRKKLSIGYSVILTISMITLSAVIYLTADYNLKKSLDDRIIGFADKLIRYVDVDNSYIGKYKTLYKGAEHSAAINDLHRIIKSDSSSILQSEVDSMTYANMVYKNFYKSVLNIFENYYLQITDTLGDVIWKSSNLQSKFLPPLTSEKLSEDSILIVIDKLFNKTVSNDDLEKGLFTDFGFGRKELRLYVRYTKSAIYSVGYDLKGIHDFEDNILLILFISLPFMIIISIIGGSVLSAKALGPIDKLSKTVRDITASNLSLRLPYSGINDEMGRLSDTLNQMILRLEQSFNQIKQFSSDASHELKTPLTILRGELELALTKPKSANEYIRIIASSLDEVIRLTNVVESLLELSRAEMGQIKINFEEHSLSRLLREICEDAEILAEQKEIELKFEIEPNVFCVFDSVRLHQAILNLIENAVKYTDNNGKIDISLVSDDKSAIFKVKDTGVGIPENQLPLIFDRFFRVDKSRSGKIAGSGLGLSIVNWIVKAHNGEIIVQSKLGVGSEFTIKLPLRN